MAGRFLEGILTALTALLAAILGLLWDLAASAFTTPDVTTIAQVEAMASTAQGVVNVTFIVAVLTIGVLVMSYGTVQTRYSLGELAPRLVIGFIAANFAIPICSALIEAANAVAEALTFGDVDTDETIAQLRTLVGPALTDQTNALLGLIAVAMLTVLTAMLLATWLIRVGLLIVLVGISPVALACHATPFTDPAARLWWRSLLGTLATVVLQVLAVSTTMTIFLDPNADTGALGIPNDPTGTVRLFIVICLLWATIRIPALIRRYVTHGGAGTNLIGMALRMVTVQRLAGLVRVPSTGRTPVPARMSRPRGAPNAGTQLPPPRGAGQGRVGIAWPTGRTVWPYTRDELATGVDLYTRTVPRRPAPPPVTRPVSTRPPIRAAGVQPNTPRGPRPSIPAGVTPATAMPRIRPVRPPTTGIDRNHRRPR
ncbi:hypothetical protein GCM10009557_00600 [Virgisporangium ochraceum]|uniref:Uncharacterized protein n=1 Tax=Virgisporangium ochraceum TaxID=65505 RepID=A0A8J4A3Z7_9ACTN|nr:hypothetical protein [Virgisporangium ochraceum]GIJ74092.1 hypothetical protein Voc01_090090 [Virgisporangium ochraceum]